MTQLHFCHALRMRPFATLCILPFSRKNIVCNFNDIQWLFVFIFFWGYLKRKSKKMIRLNFCHALLFRPCTTLCNLRFSRKKLRYAIFKLFFIYLLWGRISRKYKKWTNFIFPVQFVWDQLQRCATRRLGKS